MGKSYRSDSKHDRYKKFDKTKKSKYSHNNEQSDGKKSDWRKESDNQQN